MNTDATPLAFKIYGMDCAEEITAIKRELGPLVGDEEQLAFDILNGKLSVDGSAVISPEEVIQAVARTGMRAEVWQADTDQQADASFWQQHGRSVLTAVSGMFGLLGFLAHARVAGSISGALGSEGLGISGGVPTLAIFLYLAGITAGVWQIFPKAWRAAVNLRPDINLLMTIAVVGAAAIGEWFEAATVAFLFSVSLVLESWSVGRARRAIAALMELAPQAARVRDANGIETEVPPEQVDIGTIFIVRPGEKIPLDGQVARGESGVNQAPITGESVPVEKSSGAEIFAGTINGNGTLEIECTKRADDSTLAHIIRMVGQAQSRRAPSEK